MIYLTEVMAAFLTAFALENLLFTRAVDIPGLYEKRSLRQLLTVGGDAGHSALLDSRLSV